MWLKFCYPGLLAMTPQYMFNVFKKNKRKKYYNKLVFSKRFNTLRE